MEVHYVDTENWSPQTEERREVEHKDDEKLREVWRKEEKITIAFHHDKDMLSEILYKI